MVSQKRNRWIIQTVMILALTAFVGFSLLPILTTVPKAKQVPQQAATPTPTSASQQPSGQLNKQADLEAQARGYELVLQKEPENKAALEGLIRTRLQLNDVKGVIAPLEKLAALNANEPSYTVLLAQAKQQTGDVEGAGAAYRSILNSKPGNIDALQGMVNLLLQQNRPEAALGLLQDTIKNAPNLNKAQPGSVDVVAVQLILGQAYAQQNRYDQAIIVYDELSKTKPDDFRPILGKAIVLKTQGKVEEGKALFNRASALAPAQYKDQIQQMATDNKPAASQTSPPASQTSPPASPPTSPPASPTP
ncbi:tetratricopeptide repeat protein [Ancylothrix sp. C2]|uniref:tetratricopeptide repeat protein n=1 Tax=Ancylothrix sp. D3o TaxID=2953691 RepID=UPI0021BAF163|nr:tetratricopeptide repeat protein [Ancylothrix sp. D3o]MCT7951200.1 tetratricopeptide repeat protein [Ancylothrix sp. D3o]